MGKDIQKSNTRSAYLDILRLLCSYLVVLGHTAAQEWGNIPVTSGEWHVVNAFDCFPMSGVLLFFMISGTLFLNENYNLSIKKLYVKKILHIVIIYHVWLLIYNIIPFLQGDIAWSFVNIKEKIVFDTLEGVGIYHLWFLEDLIPLYLITPIIKEAFRKKEMCEYFLGLYIIMGIVMTTVLLFDFPGKYLVEGYYNRTTWVMLTGYIGYYVAGHYIHSFVTKEPTKKQKVLLAITAILSYVAVISICSIDALKKNEPSVIMNTPFGIPHFIAPICIFVLAKFGFDKLDVSKHSWIKLMSKASLGIYLIHPIVINIFNGIGISTIEPHPLIMIPVFSILVYSISALLVFVMLKIPGVKKLVL